MIHNTLKTVFLLCISLCMMVVGQYAYADSWSSPEKRNYYSENYRYRFRVVPGKISGNSSKRNKHPKGVLYSRVSNRHYKRISKFNLRNKIAPLDVLVSNNGLFIVTVDNWYGQGYGNNTVVIYDSNGRVIVDYKLNEILTENDIKELPHSTTSTLWLRNSFISPNMDILVLEVAKCRRSWFNCDESFRIEIELETGDIITQVRDHLPHPRIYIAKKGACHDDVDTPWSEPLCRPGAALADYLESPSLSADALVGNAISTPLPEYPQRAEYANLEGWIVLEVAVAETGEVECVRSKRGLPLGLIDTVHSAALEWRFSPFIIDGTPRKVVGSLTIELRWVDETHPAY